MLFDPENKIVKLCALGMECEGQGNMAAAHSLFERAWNEARSAFEKLTAAHYVARHQPSTEQKLKWDLTALNLAMIVREDQLKETYPSLHLNVAKGYEDLGDLLKARMHYEKARAYAAFLPDDGYGNMLKNGILNGLERVRSTKYSVQRM